jgi:serine/threonine protein kinase
MRSNAHWKENQLTMTASLESESDEPVVAVGEFIRYEHKDAAILSPTCSKKVLKYAEKRLAKSQSCELFASTQKQQQRHHDNERGTHQIISNAEHAQLELGMMLGIGSFSSVYEVRAVRSSCSSPQHSTATTDDEWMISPETSVVKVLRKSLLSNPALFAACAADLAKEAFIMGSLRHRNILSVKAWPSTGLEGFACGRHDAFFLLLDRLSDTLTERIVQWRKKYDKLKYIILQRSWKKKCFLHERLQAALQLADALQHLHRHNILHRDLKPDNVGFQVGSGVLKLFDFDVARIMPKLVQPGETFLLTKKVGSPRYMSPECGRGDAYNLKSEVYSFALLLHECISMERPYDKIAAIDHDNFVFYRGLRPAVPESWPATIQSLLQASWSQDISSRPTMKEAHAILREEVNLMGSSGKNGKNYARFRRAFGQSKNSSSISVGSTEIFEQGNKAARLSPSVDRVGSKSSLGDISMMDQ